MSTVNLTIAAIPSDGGWTVVGGGTIAGNLIDLNDTTGTTPPTGTDPQGTVIVAMSAPTLPAYGRVVSALIRLRWKGNGGQVSAAAYTTTDQSLNLVYAETPPTSPVTWESQPYTTDPAGAAWTAASLGQLAIHVWGTGDVTLTEVGVEVTVDEAPQVTILSPVGDLSADLPAIARWSANDAEKKAPESTQVRVFRASQVDQLFTPDATAPYLSRDLLGPATSVALGGLPPNAYGIYVRVSEVGSGGRYGPWGSAMFEIVGAAAGTPGLTVTPQPHLQRALLTVQRQDNLLTWEQAGGGDGSLPAGWYADTNCSAPGTAAPVAAGTEGSRVITMTTLAAGPASMTSGGPWSTGVVPAVSGQVVQDIAGTPPRVSTASYGSGPVTTDTKRWQAGTVVVATASAGSTVTGTSTGPSLSSTPALSWSLVGTTGANSSKDEALEWIAVVPTTDDYRVTLTCTDNGYAKTLGVVPWLGVDTSSPVASSGTGATQGTPNITGTAPAPGALLVGSIAEYWDRAIPTVNPGTLVSGAKVGTVGAMAVSSPAGTTGATLQIGVTAPTSGVSWSWVWLVLRPAVTPPPSVLAGAGDIVGFPIEPFKDYVGVGALWQAANAPRHGRVDVRCRSAAGDLLSTTLGTAGPTSTGTAMVDLPPTPFTAPAGSAVGELVPVMTDATAGGEVGHWDRLGVGPPGWRWSRGGTTVNNLLGAVDATQAGGSAGTWGSVSCTVLAVAASTLSGYALRLRNGAAGQILGGHSPVPIPRGATVMSAACLMLVTVASISGCWVSIRFVGADGGTLGWPGGQLVDPPTSGRMVARIEGIPIPAGAVQAQLTVTSFSAISAGQGLDCTRFGIWPTETVPAAYQVGPPTRSFALAEYSDDGGETWDYVRDTELASYGPDGSVTLPDHEICPGAQRLYRASTMVVDYRSDPAGVTSVSAASAPLPAWIPARDWWLSDPTRPGSTIPIQVAGGIGFGVAAHSARFDVLSDPSTPDSPVLPIYTFDGRGGLDQELGLIVRGHEAWAALRALIQSGATLLLQGDMGEQWYVQLADVSGTLYSSITRLVDPTRSVSVQVAEVERPPVVIA